MIAAKVVTEVLGGSRHRKGGADQGQAAAGAVLPQSGTGGRCDRHQARSARPVSIPMRPAASFNRWPPTASSARERRQRRQPRLPRQPPEHAARIELALRHARAVRRPGALRTTAIPSSPASTVCCSAIRRRKAMCAATPSMHPRLGVSFSVPAGFIIDNAPPRLLPPVRVIRRSASTGCNSADGISLADYLRSGWVAGLETPASGRRPSMAARPRRHGRRPMAGSSTSRWSVPAASVYRLLTAAPAASTSLDAVARSVGSSFHVAQRRPKRRR